MHGKNIESPKVVDAPAVSAVAPATIPFLSGGGEMGRRIREYDWVTNTMGPPENWPQSLRTALRLMLTTNHPVFVFWGKDHVCFYNDAYSASLGPEKHPAMLGQDALQAWPEIWHIIGPQIETVLSSGGSTWHEDHLVPIIRHGGLEEVYWTYSYSPIDDSGFESGVGGVLVVCTETTEKVLSERRLNFKLELSERLRSLRDATAVEQLATEMLGKHLGVGRAGFAKVDAAGDFILVESDWTDGVMPSMTGTYLLEGFGQEVASTLRNGDYVVIEDPLSDPRTSESEAAYEDAGAIRSGVAVPVLKAGALVAIFYVHQTTSRRWRQEEVALIQDVGERTWATLEGVKAESALHESEERFRAIVSQATAGISQIDLEGRFLFVNDRFCAIVGYRAEELQDLTLQDIADSESLAKYLEASLRPEPCVLEAEFKHRGGKPVCVSMSIAPVIGSEGQVTSSVCVTIDITKRREAEREVQRLYDQMEAKVAERTAELISINEQLQGFTYTVAHDLRQQIRGISTNAAIILLDSQEILHQRNRDHLERLVASSKQLAALVDDLLQYAKLGRQEPARTLVNLTELAERLREEIMLEGAYSPETQIDIEEDLVTFGDPPMLAIALQNLMDNACKYSQRSEPPRIRVGMDERGFFVEDNGIGFEMQYAEKVFEPFERLHRGLEFSGTGIGLANVKRIVEKHGGKLWVESQPSVGSKFSFSLPGPDQP